MVSFNHFWSLLVTFRYFLENLSLSMGFKAWLEADGRHGRMQGADHVKEGAVPVYGKGNSHFCQKWPLLDTFSHF